MPLHTYDTITEMARIRDALALEPSIRLDLSQAGPTTTAAFIFCRMGRGVDELDSIYQELRLRGCRYDHETIKFLLSVYEGNDPGRHLWSYYECDEYYLPLTGLPEAADLDSTLY
jgi:hypothetical protein